MAEATVIIYDPGVITLYMIVGVGGLSFVR